MSSITIPATLELIPDSHPPRFPCLLLLGCLGEVLELDGGKVVRDAGREGNVCLDLFDKGRCPPVIGLLGHKGLCALDFVHIRFMDGERYGEGIDGPGRPHVIGSEKDGSEEKIGQHPFVLA